MYSTVALLQPTQRSLRHCASRSTIETPSERLFSCSKRRIAVKGFRSSLCPKLISGSSHSLTSGLSMMLAGAVVINTLVAPLLLPLPAVSALLQAEDSTLTAQQLQPRELRATIAEAPSVRADTETSEQQQQQWWQQDQQVWQELTTPTELTAYLNSSQPPPAWPAVDSSALSPKLRLVEFYATWCPACKAAAPAMAEVAADPSLQQHCSFARVNIDRVKPLVRQLGITKIPTVLLLAPDGTTLNSFRASGQTARDAITTQLAAMQLQQQQQPSLPVLPPAVAGGGDRSDQGAEEQPAPSEVEDGTNSNGNSSNGGSGTAAAACSTAPDPSCGGLPPGVGLPDAASADTASSSTANQPSASPQATSPDTSAASPSTANDLGRQAAEGSSTVGSAGAVDQALLAAKQQFLQHYGSGYGYGGWLDQHYQQEIGYRLGPDKHYLDYTGAALYPASLLEAVHKDLLTHSYGNPHSVGAPVSADSNNGDSSNGSTSNGDGSSSSAAVAIPPAAASEAVMEAAAAAVLEHMHADPADYQVVFTRSATEALKLVGEMFPWSGSSSSSSSGSSMARQQGGTPSDMLSGALRPQQQQQQEAGAAQGGEAVSSNSNDSSSGGNSNSSGAGVSRFIYTRTNHNSVLGIGAYAAAAGAELVPQTDEGMEAWVASLEQQQQQDASASTTYSLLAYPAEDNYAGAVYPLDWITRVHAASSPSQRTLVLLDAAAYLPTHELNLTTHPADFVVASFYKMFGYPTGLGVLVIRTEHVPLLNKVYFGGGSVALATPEGCWHVNKCDPAAALSDGTPNYLGAAALKLAYDAWDSRGGMQAVEQHTQALSSWLYSQLSSLRHSNGVPLIQLYGRHDQQAQGAAGAGQAAGFSQGAVFNFQVSQADGQPISFSKIDREATAAGIYLRSGCVCNPGACYDSLGLEAAEVQGLAGLKEGCGDEMDFITVQRPSKPASAASNSSSRGSWWPWRGAGGTAQQQPQPQQQQQQQQENGVVVFVHEGLVPTQVPLGSVRASLGWASTIEDAYAFVQFLRGYLS